MKDEKTGPISNRKIIEGLNSGIFIAEDGLNLPEYKKEIPKNITILQTRQEAQEAAENHEKGHTPIFDKHEFRSKDCDLAWRWSDPPTILFEKTKKNP